MAEVRSKEAISQWWDAHPCNLLRSSNPVGSSAFFADVERNKYRVEPHIPAFAEFALWKGKRVLELGCGLGTETTNFARHGASVVAVDISSVSLDLLRQRLEHEGLSGSVRLVHGDCEQVDELLRAAQLDQQPFDLVWAFGSLHHTHDPGRAIAAACRLLRPNGGQLRAMVYSRHCWKRFDLLHTQGPWTPGPAGDSTVTDGSEANRGSPVTFTYSLREARELFERSGPLHVSSVTKTHVFRYAIEPYRRGQYELDAKFVGMTDEQLQDLEEELGWHTLLRCVKQ